MCMTTSLLAALSAVLYGAGVAVEHRQAARTPPKAAGRPWMLALLARQPLWLIGAALEAGGFALHAAALRSGSLLAVQMILGCSLLVSVSLSSVLTRQPLPRRCWPAIVAIVASVAVSLAMLGPDEHAGGQAPASGRTATAVLVTGLITLPIAAAGLLANGRRTRPLLLAAAAGTADTCVAVLTMAFAHTFGHGLSAVATSWPLYALIVGGPASLALTQAAYQTNAPLVTLPIISAVTPLASLTVGILILREATHLSSTRSVIGGSCLALAVTALIVLARAAATLANPGNSKGKGNGEYDLGESRVRRRSAPRALSWCRRVGVGLHQDDLEFLQAHHAHPGLLGRLTARGGLGGARGREARPVGEQGADGAAGTPLVDGHRRAAEAGQALNPREGVLVLADQVVDPRRIDHEPAQPEGAGRGELPARADRGDLGVADEDAVGERRQQFGAALGEMGVAVLPVALGLPPGGHRDLPQLAIGKQAEGTIAGAVREELGSFGAQGLEGVLDPGRITDGICGSRVHGSPLSSAGFH